MSRKTLWWFCGLVLVALAGGVFYAWHLRRSAPVVTLPPVTEPATPQPVASAPAEPAIKYPVEAAASAPPGEATVPDALAGLLGRAEVQRFLQLDDFARRFVATVDNLPREQASARLWPVLPTPGRFTPAPQGERGVLGPVNAQRYAPFVRFVESVDVARAVALYRRLYPRLQQAYIELGYPRGYFNDRLIEVIDHLLRTPEPAGDVVVAMTEIKGPVRPARPWVLYEFADPALASRSAGQQLMLRMGVEHERRLKAKLVEVRALLVGRNAAGR